LRLGLDSSTIEPCGGGVTTLGHATLDRTIEKLMEIDAK